MRNCILFLFVMLWSAVAVASEGMTLDQQIQHVKAYLEKIQNPRLILGVGNTIEENSPEAKIFLDNPDDILLNIRQKPGVLENRTLTVNFNKIDELNKLASAFENTFNVIIPDTHVIKYADWTSEHLSAFKKMLKPGGTLFLPIETLGDPVSMVQGAKTEQELFDKTIEAIAPADRFTTSPRLFIVNKYAFYFPPTNLDIKIDPKLENEIAETVKKYKELATPFIAAWENKKLPKTEANLAPLREEFAQKGLNPQWASRLTSSILNDDSKLTNFVRSKIMEPRINEVKEKLSDDFMKNYVIQGNWLRIVGGVFGPQKIVIKKGMALPQPYRYQTHENYTISAAK